MQAFFTLQDDEDDDDDDDYSDGEETPLECFATPLDDEETDVDEYIIFKEVLIGNNKNNDLFIY